MPRRRKKSSFRRALLRWTRWFALALLVLGIAGAVSYHFFTGWRARDLAAKAKENFEKANYRLAWLQISSAKDLQSEEPDVLRVLAMIEAAMGKADALDRYDKLSTTSDLTPEDLKARAEVAMRFGNDAQFDAAAEDLDKAGLAFEAGALRTARQLRQGDIDRAIGEARVAAGASDDPALRLGLARLLLQRYGPESGPGKRPSAVAIAGSAEAVGIIDGLIDTPLRNEALALAIKSPATTPPDRRRWAAAAMERIDTENPALLPAATVLVRSRQKTPQQINEQLRPIFDAAPLERRAAYALWLTGAGMPKEAVTLVTAREAGESTAAFMAHTEALFAADNFDAVLAAVEAGGNVDADVRLAAKARAEYARGRGAQGGAAALREAMDAAARNNRLERILPTGDALGAFQVIDEKLAELCGDPAVADHALRVARDRFSRTGRTSLLDTSLKQALAASPQSAVAQDLSRYRALTRGGKVSLDETAAACAAEPSNVTFRITHALNLLKNQRPAEALKTFEDITVFADRVPPGQAAVLAAVLAANGDTARARAAATSIDPDLLAPGEYALILSLRAAPGNGE
jgi:hypothetical protein